MPLASLPALHAALSAFAAAAISWLAAAAYVAINGGFGAGDLWSFAIWCVLFGAVLWFALAMLSRAQLPVRRTRRAMMGAAFGICIGTGFTFALAFGMGGWFGAYSFPALYAWMLGAAIGMGFGLAYTPHQPEGTRVGRVLLKVGAVLGATLVFVIAAPLLLTLGSVYLWDRAQPEIHLLPNRFRGPVVIVFGQPDGEPERREGNARVYVIPADGVLRTQLPPNRGWGKPDYYYVDSAGRRTRVVAGTPCNDSLPGDPVQACLMGQLAVWEGRTGAEHSAYVVARRADRRRQSDRGDSLVRVTLFGAQP